MHSHTWVAMPSIMNKQKDGVVQSVYISNIDPLNSYETEENYLMNNTGSRKAISWCYLVSPSFRTRLPRLLLRTVWALYQSRSNHRIKKSYLCFMACLFLFVARSVYSLEWVSNPFFLLLDKRSWCVLFTSAFHLDNPILTKMRLFRPVTIKMKTKTQNLTKTTMLIFSLFLSCLLPKLSLLFLVNRMLK